MRNSHNPLWHLIRAANPPVLLLCVAAGVALIAVGATLCSPILTRQVVDELASGTTVLEAGRISGVGKHDELVASHPYYARLVARQFRTPSDSVVQEDRALEELDLPSTIP